MSDLFLLGLIAKAVATALVVVTATAAAERSGPFWGGLISCLPVSAGPAYVLLAIQHDTAFVSVSAQSSLATNISTWMFILAFLFMMARKWPLWPSLIGALLVWLILVVSIRQLDLSVPVGIAGSVVSYFIAEKFAPRMAIAPGQLGTVRRGWYELPVRAILVGLFVAALVTVSDAIGAAVTGIAAVFPIALSSLAVVTYRRFGPLGAGAAMASAIRPLVGIVIALTVVHYGVPLWGDVVGLSSALIASLVWPLALIIARRRSIAT